MTGVEVFAIGSTMITLGDVMMVVGAISSIAGAMQQSQFQQDQAEYNAAVSRNNALAARQKALSDADRLDREQRLRSGEQRNTYAGNGVLLEGTPLDLMHDTEIEAKLDILMKVYNSEINEANALAQATQFDSAKDNAFTGVAFGAGATLLTTGSKVGTKKGTKKPLGALASSAKSAVPRPTSSSFLSSFSAGPI